MSWTLSKATRSAMMNAFAGQVDAGSGAAKIRVYDGVRPADPDTAVTDQTLLLEFTLADPSFGSASDGVITLDADPDLHATGLANGTATWARVVDSDSNPVADCKVSAAGGGGDLIMSTTTVTVGLDVAITSGSLTMPAGSAD